jgi:two-component system, chemotaxis family, CheB/CheR fusion protein
MSKPKTRSVRKRAERHRGITPRLRPGPDASATPAQGASPARLRLVGLGASAGGLEALQQFLSGVRSDSGMAFVIVTHQHPDAPTLLPQLLARHSQVPVTVVAENLEPEPNHVYVAPPGRPISFEGGRFHFGQAAEHERPIDHLFKSLARELREDAIAVVLSGTGSDGTLGITEIKTAGGLVLAQDTSSARFSGMPSSAAATRLLDGVMAPEHLPVELSRLVSRRQNAAGSPLENGAAVDRLLQTLRRHTGHDFAAYKKSTLLRRIERRMNSRAIASVDEYCDLLERDHEETQVLFREFLISVTGFFRDPDVFDALRSELRTLLEAHDSNVTFRAWIPACATGEEAYSIAITISELMAELGRNPTVQVFATDLDAQAVDAARAGRYPLSIAADVGAERLERFFVKHDDEYRVKKEVRELIVFAVQNVIKDPPFTKLHLVSCRNLLIYLEPALQRRVLALFSYALRPGGLLLLGSSENVPGPDDLFVSTDRKHKLFRRERSRFEAPSEFPQPPSRPRPESLSRPRLGGREGSGLGPAAERALLKHLAPASVLVTDRGDILYFHGRTGQFLEPAAGEPGSNLFGMARAGLRLELPAALRQAAAQQEPVIRAGLSVESNGGVLGVKVTVRRLDEPELGRETFLVSFEVDPDGAKKAQLAGDERGPEGSRARELELELEHTRENLQGTIEELETSNEELKSTNEELQSTNEELQSANEELETSREEMQSLNEELQTVNSELGERNQALSQANDDMQNLLNSTDIATVFLDSNLAIKRFTTQARRVFSLIDTDIGRPISDLTANVRYQEFVQDAREVLRSLVFKEREIQTKEGAWRLMRIMPYRTAENLIDGLVMTFIDIDRIKRNETEALARRAFLEHLLEALPNGVAVLDAALTIASANSTFYEILRTSPKRALNERLHLDGVLEAPELAAELERVLADGHEVWGLKVSPQNRLKEKALRVCARRFHAPGAEQPSLVLVVEDVGQASSGA